MGRPGFGQGHRMTPCSTRSDGVNVTAHNLLVVFLICEIEIILLVVLKQAIESLVRCNCFSVCKRRYNIMWSSVVERPPVSGTGRF